MKVVRLSVITICLLLIQAFGLVGQSNIDIVEKLKKQGIIVRIPTNGKKIKTLRSLVLQNPENTKLQKLLDNAIDEDRNRYDRVTSLMSQHFHSVVTYFVPDSLYRNFLDGESHVFLDQNARLENTPNIERKDIFLLSLSDKDQFLLTDADGNRLPDPLPYKKSIFLNSLKRVFFYEKYLITQVEYFDMSIKKLLDENN